MKRRDFCKAAPCAAMAATSPAFLSGANEEAKKITAVQAKVIKGSCAYHKIEDMAEITELGVKGKICIHALYSMLPAVFAMLYDAQFTWLEDPDTKTHACPDAFNPVVFEITRIREKD